jgi:penicillin-binding protein 2
LNTRYLKIFSVLIVIALIFVARIAYLQLFTDRYALNAANTSIKIEYVIPQRGVIFDRNGKILVGNQPAYEISFTQALMRPDFDTVGFCNLMKISKMISSEPSKILKKKNIIPS